MQKKCSNDALETMSGRKEEHNGSDEEERFQQQRQKQPL
jgi:hypothetical protein